jgi:hypothetical protein
MPRDIQGSVFKSGDGYGIRWPANGSRPQKVGFRTKTEARDWFTDNVKPRLRRPGPSADILFETFCVDYLERWGAGVEPRTKATLEEWLTPAREQFGGFTLGELEGAADDISRWRSRLPTEHARYKHTRAIRQVLAAARRWGYVTRNPAVDMGSNPIPRSEEVRPFGRPELDAIVVELADSASLEAPLSSRW